MRDNFRRHVVDQRAYRFAGNDERRDGVLIRAHQCVRYYMHHLTCGHWELRNKFFPCGRLMKCHSCEYAANNGGKFFL